MPPPPPTHHAKGFPCTQASTSKLCPHLLTDICALAALRPRDTHTDGMCALKRTDWERAHIDPGSGLGAIWAGKFRVSRAWGTVLKPRRGQAF